MGGTSLSGRWSTRALVLLIRQGGTHVGETAPSTLLGPEGSGPLVSTRVLPSVRLWASRPGLTGRHHAERLPSGVRGEFVCRSRPYLENCTVDASIHKSLWSSY